MFALCALCVEEKSEAERDRGIIWTMQLKWEIWDHTSEIFILFYFYIAHIVSPLMKLSAVDDLQHKVKLNKQIY